MLEHALTQHPGRYLAILELALESTRDPGIQRSFVGITDAAMKLTYHFHEADDTIPARDVQLLSVLYNGLLFTGLVMPGILGGRGPGEVTRDALEKLL